MIRRVASALLVGGLLGTGAFGQTTPPLIAKPGETPPPNPTPNVSARPDSDSSAPALPAPRGFSDPVPTDPAHPNYHAGAHRSIMRHNPYPSRTARRSNDSSSSQASGGFTTGGVGRMSEYYDDRTLNAPIDYHHVPVGSFDSGGGPNRNEQLQAQAAGQQRTSNIQSNINAYGRPYGALGAGLGFGFGLGSGLYGYPN